MTNKQFAEKDKSFKDACANVKWKWDKNIGGSLPPTKRQASKFRRGFGIAYKTMKEGNDG